MVCNRCRQALGAILLTTFISVCFSRRFPQEDGCTNATKFFSNRYQLRFDQQPLSQEEIDYYLGDTGTGKSDHDFISPVSNGFETLHFPAFGESFSFNLKPRRQTINGKDLVIKVKSRDGKTKISSPSQGCFFTDFDAASSINMDFCGEVTGMIKQDGLTYDILPLKDSHVRKIKAKFGEKDAPTHIITRRSPGSDEKCTWKGQRVDKPDTENKREEKLKYETRTLEVSVVADDKMFEKYGDETESYILNVLHQVATTFQDGSLDTTIKIHVADFTILESEQDDLHLVDELSETLTSFCEWQKSAISDISILITGRDLQTGGNHLVAGKAADIGGACDPLRRCIVSDDNGPSGLALTLTHEIGHSIGMFHDDAYSDCHEGHFIMSPTESSAVAPGWSPCSNKDLSAFLNSPDSACLENTPESLPHSDGYTVILQGMYMDASQQCQHLHGKYAKANPKSVNTMSICTDLHCIVDGKEVDTYSAALDGTQCGSNKRQICLQRSCVNAYSTQVCADNPGGICVPEWITDNWGECIDCSETREIFCVEFQDDGSILLVTDLSRCPVQRPSTTRFCCNETSTFTYFVGAYGPCPATCGTGLMQTRVVECRNQNGATVSDSSCSGVKPPTARLCPGLTACPTQNSYSIFAGAFGECSATCGPGIQTRSIFCILNNAQQVDPSECTQNGLEVPPSQQACQVQPCATETYRYIGGTFGGCSVTCGVGVQTRLVICVDSSNIRVDDSFCVNAGLDPLATTQQCTLDPCVVNQFQYTAGEFPPCTITCGTAVVTRLVTCTNQNGVVFPDVICETLQLTRPEEEFICSFPPCSTFAFRTGAFGQCSVTCGSGVQIRTVECINELTNEVVSDAFCTGQRPSEFQACVEEPCEVMYRYVAGPFGDCSCEGIQTRIILCVSVVGVTFTPVNTSFCVANNVEEIPASAPCTPPVSCSSPVWAAQEFGECSVTCGTGIQTRFVFCVESPGSSNIVPNDLCVAADEPASFQACDTGVECPPEYIWLATEFSECSVTCGDGFQTRSVFCYSVGLSGDINLVDPANCVAADEPASVIPCSESPCDGVFVATEWSACSETCGQGIQTRTVSCARTKAGLDLLPLSECGTPVPPDTQPCFLRECPAAANCDISLRAQATSTTISSPNYPNDYPSDIECPTVIRATEGNHVEITFTDFVLETGCVFDYLLLEDTLDNNTSTLLCDENSIPELPYTYRSVGPEVNILFKTDVSIQRRGFIGSFRAVSNDVYEYSVGPFSECDVTCGEGTQTREVFCLLNGEVVDDDLCLGLDRPATTQACSLGECPGPDACGVDILRTEAGLLTSPEFPSDYPANVTCSNILQAPEGQVVLIASQFVNLEDSPNCEKDALLISDVSRIAQPLSFCGEVPPQLIFRSLTNRVRITFRSDGENQGSGFQIAYQFVAPTPTDCGSLVRSSGDVITSPDYPNNYNNSEDCSVGILNVDGCIEIVFTDLDVVSDRDCGQDVVLVEDLVNSEFNRRICGTFPPHPFQSASGSVRITLFSDRNNTGRGYVAVPRFVECPAAIRVTSDWGPCSTSCGEGIQERNVTCLDTMTRLPVPDEACGDRQIPSERRCNLGECPSCDFSITEQQSEVVVFPPGGGPYENNQDCRITISHPTQCVTIVIVSFDVEPGIFPGSCEFDFAEFTDASNPLVSLKLCGDPRPYPAFVSISNTVFIDFSSDRNIVGDGFSFYPNFNDCPVFAYIPEPFSSCSVTCGVGVRTRNVQCRSVATNNVVADSLCEGDSPYPTEERCVLDSCPSCSRFLNESGIIVSPDAGDGNYPNNSFCQYRILAPLSQCISLSFLEFDLERPSEEGLCYDYLRVDDDAFPFFEYVFCGNGTDMIISRSNAMTLTFSSDQIISAEGYQILVNFVECPDFAYDVGPFGECSVTCGDDGFVSRSVECINVQTLRAVEDSLCPNVRPRTTQPCAPQEECIPCDQVITEGDTFVDSFNFPGNYDNNQECLYTIVNPDGCIRLSVFLFSLGDGDSLEFADDGYDGLTVTATGDDPLSTWTSRTGNVTLTFRSDDEDNEGNFRMLAQFVTCPLYGYVAGPFSECSATCGEAIRTRDVPCVELDTNMEVEERLCNDPKPALSEECELPPCPTCDRYINESSEDMGLRSPGYPLAYPPGTTCSFLIESVEGKCINIFIIGLDTEGPEEGTLGADEDCIDLDGIFFVDLEFPYRVGAFCGQSGVLTTPIESYGSSAFVQFYSNDNEVVGSGLNAFVAFVDCTAEYAYRVGNFSECDATCGSEAVRSREVDCIEIESGDVVSLEMCDEEAPESIQPCLDLPECPSCDAFFNSSITMVRQPDFPLSYPANTECVYTLENSVGTCIRIAFTDFDLPGLSSECKDYLEITDTAYPFNDPVRECPREGDLPTVYRSLSSRIEVRFVSDEESVGGSWTFFGLREACPEYAYVAGPYNECPVTCGEVSQTREVNCINLSLDVVVPDSFCTGPRPTTSRECDLEECPSCNEVILEPAAIIQSPLYPENYGPLTSCSTVFVSGEQCISLFFTDVDLEPRNETTGVCEGDKLQIVDNGYLPLSRTICGNELIGSEWQSRTPNVMLLFTSDLNGIEGGGFNIFSTNIDCPTNGFVFELVGTCSVTCGEGVQERNVQCLNLDTNMPVDDSECSDPRPDDFEPCVLEECPVCDRTITNTGVTLSSENHPSEYPPNQECEFDFLSPDGRCWSIFFNVLDFPDPDPELGCVGDYLLLEETGMFGKSERLCGRRDAFFVNTVYPDVRFTLFTDDEESANTGFFIAATFLQDCPMFGYFAGEFGNCSKTCGGGVRSRTVTCVDLSNGDVVSDESCEDQTPPSETEACNVDPCPSCDQFFDSTNAVLRSPNYPLNYEPNQVCSYRINYPEGSCARVEFEDFSLQGPIDGVCSADYLEISDDEELTDHLTRRYCGGRGNTAMWISRSENVTITLSTDSSIEESGFSLRVFFTPCPPFGYIYSPWSECSVTCGSGIETRNSSCINLSTREEVPDDACPETPPELSRVCIRGPCPSCDEVITTSGARVTSPNYPMSYPNSANCEYTIYNPDGCVQLLFEALSLEQEDDVCVDSIEFADDGEPRINTEYCGAPTLLPTSWHSLTSNVTATFSSSVLGAQSGFSFITNFVACSEYNYVVDNIGICSASCEGGIQNRSVTCQRMPSMDVVDDDYCEDEKPAEFVACNDVPCPIECGNAITTDTPSVLDVLQSPGYGFVPYANDLRCANTIINFDGCIQITLLELDIQPGSTPLFCDNDYVLINDPSYPSISTRYCGNTLPTFSWRSGSSVTQVTLVSDGSIRAAGYSLTYSFVDSADCPENEFSAGPFSECDAACGEGTQTREVSCLNENNELLPNSACRGARPEGFRACFPAIPPCPSYQYETTPFGECSVTCGGGTQSRNVTCVDVEGNEANETLCQEARPDSVQPCNVLACPQTYSYVIGNFSECSVTCGSGFRNRTVECQNQDDVVVMSSFCDGPVPPSAEICEGDPCFEYLVGNFSECSETCGVGMQTRNVTCVNFGTMTPVNEAFCSDLEEVTESQACFVQVCPVYNYRVTVIEECSVTCGNGTQTRSVLCFDQFDNMAMLSDCAAPVPETTLPCATGVECPIQEAACGNTVDAINSGMVTSPNYPGNYPNDLNCIITFRISDGSVMSFVFQAFDLDLGMGSCDKDFIRIVGVESTTSVNLCNTLVLPFEYSTNLLDRTVRLEFTTDSSTTAMGFLATYEEIVIGG